MLNLVSAVQEQVLEERVWARAEKQDGRELRAGLAAGVREIRSRRRRGRKLWAKNFVHFGLVLTPRVRI